MEITNMPLADLKKALKEFKTTQTPKLSAKKADLMAYAKRVGIIKSPEAVEAPAPVPSEPKTKVTNTLLKVKETLPEVLKAPKAEKASKKNVPAPVEPAKKTSPFAAYMAANKGKGLSMSQLAEAYKGDKRN